MMCSSPNVRKLPTHRDGNEQRTSQDECRKNTVDRIDRPASKKIELGPMMTQVADRRPAMNRQEVQLAPAMMSKREWTPDVVRGV